MKKESCTEASNSWTVHDFPCLLGSKKLVFNYRYEKYIVETSFCWRQGKHYALELLSKHLTGSTHRALPTPPAAPYPFYPQRPICSTLRVLLVPATEPYPLHSQRPTPSISETAVFLCSLYKSHWSAVFPCSSCFSRARARVSSQEMFLKWEVWSAELKQWWSLPKASCSGWMECCLEEQSPRHERNILVVSLGAPVHPLGEGQGQDCKGSHGMVLGQKMAWVPPTTWTLSCYLGLCSLPLSECD